MAGCWIVNNMLILVTVFIAAALLRAGLWRIFMNTTGIIAEYNPFHNGHLYQIETIRRETGACNIVVVMSGCFVQRGTPAFTDKYLRTAMALKSGADFVFELPVIYSSASAGLFALGGVSLLDSLGFVDSICFGSECNNINILKKAADILNNGSSRFNSSIKALVKSGFSYPAAQQMAAEKHFPDAASGLCRVLENPNDILAIEYLKALKLTGSQIVPFTIKRCDNGYNNKDYTDNQDNFISAAAIRNLFSTKDNPLNAVSAFVPVSTYNILSQNTGRININEDMFSDMLYYKLRSIINTYGTAGSISCLTKFLDVSGALSGRIIKNASNFNTFTEFARILKTKQYTYSRICRSLLHILLDIYTDCYNTGLPLSARSHIPPLQVTPYARLLGMNRNKSHMLKNIKNTVLITKTADAIRSFKNSSLLISHGLADFAIRTFEKDIFASDLYRRVSKRNNSTCPDEYRAGVIII